jgi:hypothetical protein
MYGKPAMTCFKYQVLKVLTNEKRDGLKVISFERSPCKLFTLRYSNKSVQVPSRERPKTAPRTLFLVYYLQTIIVSQYRLYVNDRLIIINLFK